MSRFFSPKYLKYQGAAATKATMKIDQDLPCRGCGYNLRGLMQGGRCPECGLEMLAPGRSGRFNILHDSGPALRQRLTWGLRTAAFGLGGLIACRLWLLAPIPGRDDLVVVDGISIFFSLVLIVGVYLSLPSKLNEYGRAMRHVRRAAIALQFAWPPAFTAILLYDLGALTISQDEYAWSIWVFGRMLGGAGVLVFLWIAATIALDADCEDESRMLGGMAWAVLFVSLFVGLLPRGMAPVQAGWFFYGFLAILIVLWGILALLAVFYLLRLSDAFAAEHALITRTGTRGERIRETRDELQREVESKIRRYPTDP